jgi:gamma-glutamylputrescine oxidase
MWAGQGQKRIDACDVVVVGAGLEGAAVAERLARGGFETAVLEARGVAGGATGRSAGMVLTGLAGHYNWAVSAYGRERAREAWALTVEGRKRLVEAAERLEVPVTRTGSLAVAVEASEAQALEESTALLQEDGFDVHFDPGDPLNRGFHAALRHPDDVTVDAASLARALLTTNDLTIHEGTEVYSLEPERNGVRVWAQGRTVLCSAVVLAVNGYAPLLDFYFTDKVAPIRSLILATEPLEETVLKQPCYADYGYEYCRQLPDRRLLLGGWRRPRSLPGPFTPVEGEESGEETEEIREGDVGDVIKDKLVHFASRYCPEIETQNANHWSGVMGFTSDGLPLIGRLPNLPQVYFAVGFGGRGLAWAFPAAEQLVELMLHDTEPGLLSATRLGQTPVSRRTTP